MYATSMLSTAQLSTLALKILAAQDRAGTLPAIPVGMHGPVSFALQVSAQGVTVAPSQFYTKTVEVAFAGEVLPALTEAHAEALAIFSASMLEALRDAGQRCGRGEGWALAVTTDALARAYGAGVTDAAAASLAVLKTASRKTASPTFLAKCKAVWEGVFKASVSTGTRAGATKVAGGVVTVAE